MLPPLDSLLGRIANEEAHLAETNEAFIYFSAVSESFRRKQRSSLFDHVPHLPAIEPSAEVLGSIRECLLNFVEQAHGHPNIGVAYTILGEIHGKSPVDYFRTKLHFHYGQAQAGVCYQLCLVLEDLGEDVWRDENGAFIGSRSYNDMLVNLGVAQRYLARYAKAQGTPPRAGRKLKVLNKSLAALLNLPALPTHYEPDSSLAQRRRLLNMPISALSPENVAELMKTGIGENLLVPAAIQWLEKKPTLFYLLAGLLRVRDFDWLDHPAEVASVRLIVSQALNELSQHDATPEIALEALQQRALILGELAQFERSLSKIPELVEK